MTFNGVGTPDLPYGLACKDFDYYNLQTYRSDFFLIIIISASNGSLYSMEFYCQYCYHYKSSTQIRHYTIFAMYWLLLLLPIALATNSFIPSHRSLPPDLRIVDGDVIDIRETPYQASLQTLKEGHFCSGSILSTRFVLTVAHFF